MYCNPNLLKPSWEIRRDLKTSELFNFSRLGILVAVDSEEVDRGEGLGRGGVLAGSPQEEITPDSLIVSVLIPLLKSHLIPHRFII